MSSLEASSITATSDVCLWPYIQSAVAYLTTERSCSTDTSARPPLEAGLELLRRIEERASACWIQ